MPRFIFDKGYDLGRWLPFVKRIHGFVLDKPSQIRRTLLESGAAKKADFQRPSMIAEATLAAIHSPKVLDGLRSARDIAAAVELAPLAALPAFVARKLIVAPQLLACDGTRLALEHAARGEWAFNLSGGFHHARPSLSHGFCLVNDVAWAVHSLPDARSHTILVLDLDLHQGDGNAAAFTNVANVFTASLHQQDAFPTPKVPGDLDVGLAAGVDDDEYLEALDALLASIRARFSPTIVVYVAGTDPFAGDSIGGFELTADAIVERDRRVARYALEAGAGLVALPAGGYSELSPTLSARGFAAMAAIHRASNTSVHVCPI